MFLKFFNGYKKGKNNFWKTASLEQPCTGVHKNSIETLHFFNEFDHKHVKLSNNPVLSAVNKFRNHPSILKIKSNLTYSGFTQVVIYAATWVTFKPKLEKIKKSVPKKYFYLSGNGALLSKKILMKLFFTLDKTFLGETGCLSNLHYLLVAQPSNF